MSTRQRAAVLILFGVCCQCRSQRAAPPRENAPQSSASSSIARPEVAPEPRQGMVWIPRGPLVAGTPEGSLPRVADEEMPGEQVILKGYYIDVFPYPNEEGAIPLTNVSQVAASALCDQRGKRLCSELEWERACKGPNNHRYEYGENYRAERCGTGAVPVMRPTGIRVSCRSDFGARDLHGGAWEWTASSWGRGTGSGLFSVRGGNSPDGELVGRCANARGERPSNESGTIGFRCCAGPPNTVEVVLDIKRGASLELLRRIDKPLLTQILDLLPAAANAELGPRARLSVVDHQWLWRPIGNEELFATRVCSGLGRRPACGVAISRNVLGRASVLAWASSRHWLPSVETDRDVRDLWMIGGDETGTYQRLIQYRFGSVVVTLEEHRLRESTKKKKKKKG
ncbi:MAG TPA: SUMF1/EgtB/PvdO family nonheme iron enzyme [Polyangiaceae bacterium]|nr:SUMF1/EgtB/PvdO family nonheme iron enzyme [Polyangiaceae bacterium]